MGWRRWAFEFPVRWPLGLSLACVQLVECALQLFKLLSSLTEFALRRQALVVSKVFGGFRYERAEISFWLRF